MDKEKLSEKDVICKSSEMNVELMKESIVLSKKQLKVSIIACILAFVIPISLYLQIPSRVWNSLSEFPSGLRRSTALDDLENLLPGISGAEEEAPKETPPLPQISQDYAEPQTPASANNSSDEHYQYPALADGSFDEKPQHSVNILCSENLITSDYAVAVGLQAIEIIDGFLRGIFSLSETNDRISKLDFTGVLMVQGDAYIRHHIFLIELSLGTAFIMEIGPEELELIRGTRNALAQILDVRLIN